MNARTVVIDPTTVPPAPSGAMCEDCNQNMKLADSCTVPILEDDHGNKYQRIPYGQETGGYGCPLPDRCHDCGAAAAGPR